MTDLRLKDHKYWPAVKAVLQKHGQTSFRIPKEGGVLCSTGGPWYEILKKEGLEHWLEEVPEKETRPEIEKGKWYKVDWRYNGDIDLFYAERVDGGRVIFDKNFYRNGEPLRGERSVSLEFYRQDERFKFSEATDKEVEELLKTEAKRRYEGVKYVKDAKYTGMDNSYPLKLNDLRYEGNLINSTHSYLFVDGNWAEPLGQYTLPEIAGYEGKDLDNHLSWGCQTFRKDLLMDLKVMKIAKIVASKGITLEQLEQIQEYLSNNK